MIGAGPLLLLAYLGCIGPGGYETIQGVHYSSHERCRLHEYRSVLIFDEPVDRDMVIDVLARQGRELAQCEPMAGCGEIQTFLVQNPRRGGACNQFDPWAEAEFVEVGFQKMSPPFINPCVCCASCEGTEGGYWQPLDTAAIDEMYQ